MRIRLGINFEPPDIDRETSADCGGVNSNRYCLGCGYNLRGLSGDPIRCPECGRANSAKELDLPARTISAQLKQLETASANSVFTVLGLMTYGFLIPWLIRFVGIDRIQVLAYAGGFVVLACAWVYSLRESRKSCENHPQWGGAILRYHLFGLAMIVGCLVVGAGTIWFVIRSARSIYPFLAIPAAAIAIIIFVRRMYAAAVRDMHPLQRAMAVRIAAHTLAKRSDISRQSARPLEDAIES